jgi:hypothetical protein
MPRPTHTAPLHTDTTLCPGAHDRRSQRYQHAHGRSHAEADAAGPPRHALTEMAAMLPRLPVPRLEATVARYVDSVAALLAPAELARTQAHAAALLAGPGPELQRRVEQLAAGPGYPERWVAHMRRCTT